jgi:hypothetical protein
VRELQTRIDRTRQRLDRLVDFIADGNASESVAATIRDLETHLKTDRRQLADLEAAAQEPVKLPSLNEVLARCLELEARIKDDPVAGL